MGGYRNEDATARSITSRRTSLWTEEEHRHADDLPKSGTRLACTFRAQNLRLALPPFQKSQRTRDDGRLAVSRKADGHQGERVLKYSAALGRETAHRVVENSPLVGFPPLVICPPASADPLSRGWAATNVLVAAMGTWY